MFRFIVTILLVFALTACSTPTPTSAPPLPITGQTDTPEPTAQPTETILPTEAVSPTTTSEPVDSATINPLTGLPVSDPGLLERRPLIVKVENLPRQSRPQYGLSLADLVFEYYTEEGTTRFIAVYYGKDAEIVAPIRSARFFDLAVVQMYKGIFAFGSAYKAVMDRLQASDVADQLVIETPRNCPPMCRLDPGGANLLSTNTAELSKYAAQLGIANDRQDLSGMTFSEQVPEGGQEVSQAYVRFSSAIYNRWDYDPTSSRYLRFVDQQNASAVSAEVYVQLTDRLNQQPIAADNIVVLITDYEYFVKTLTTEVFEIDLMGSGDAYALRNGLMFKIKWQRPTPESILSLTYEDGSPYPFKPGNTWFEVLSLQSTQEQQASSVRFTFVRP